MSEAPQVKPQTALIGLFIATARIYGLDAVGPIRDQLMRLTGEMFDGPELAAFYAINDLVDRGSAPGPGDIMALAPEELTLPVISRFAAVERHYASLKGATDAVIADSEVKRTRQALAEAQAALQRGDLALARALMSDGASEGPSRGLREVRGFESFRFNPTAEKRASVGLPRLDAMLGGGIGFGGRITMSLWIAGTGVGKSTIMQGTVVPAWLRQGHWVVYFTGEASSEDVMSEVARMESGTTFEQMDHARTKQTPALLERIQGGVDRLAALPGRFIPEDDDFTDASVRLIAAARKAQLDEAKRAGEAHEDAELIVVVDNFDHAVDALDSRHREDQIFNAASRRFTLHARRHGYHLALLHQTNADGERRSGAPLKHDVASSKAIVNHAAFMLTFYRPTTEEDHADADTDSMGRPVPGRRARHWAAVRKARGGKVGELELASDPNTGRWFDPNYTEPAF